MATKRSTQSTDQKTSVEEVEEYLLPKIAVHTVESPIANGKDTTTHEHIQISSSGFEIEGIDIILRDLRRLIRRSDQAQVIVIFLLF